MSINLSDLYQCVYCGYTSEIAEFFEYGNEEPICPDCYEDLTGDLEYPLEEEEEEEEE